jgi:hypothetical protein
MKRQCCCDIVKLSHRADRQNAFVQSVFSYRSVGDIDSPLHAGAVLKEKS